MSAEKFRRRGGESAETRRLSKPRKKPMGIRNLTAVSILMLTSATFAAAQAGNSQSQSQSASSPGDSNAAPSSKTLVTGKIAWDHYLPIKGDIKPPRPLDTPPPSNGSSTSTGGTPPNGSTKPGKTGTVILLIAISETGNVDGAKIVRGLSYDLDRKALATVSTWRFLPATKKLLPVPVQVNAEVNFFIQ